MKLSVLLSAALLIGAFASASAQMSSIPDARKAKLKGKVFLVKEMDVERLEYFHADTIAKYRRMGKKLPEYDTIPDRATMYDRYGYITETNQYSRYSPTRTTTKVYLDQARHPGLMRKEITFENGKTHRVYTLTYDDRMLPVSGEARDAAKELLFTESYNCDIKGDSIYMRATHTSTTFPEESYYVVMRKDRSIARLDIDKGHSATRFVLDEMERPLTTYLRTYKGEETYTMVFTDNKNYQYKKSESGAKVLTAEETLDAAGNTVKRVQYAPDGSVESISEYSYDYDPHGNWTRRVTTYSDGKRQPEITLREIEYYSK